MTEFSVSLLNAANFVYVLCYGVRDVLWLRILAVIAMLMIVPYYLWGPQGIQLHCLRWQVVFVCINVAWIVYITVQRWPPRMTDDQRLLYESIFKESCSPKQMLHLLRLAEWSSADADTKLVEKGQDPHQLILIERGDAVVRVDGKRVAEVGKGDFVAEMSYLTGKKTVADVVACEPMRYLVWTSEALEKLFLTHVELKSVLNELIGRNLVEKITSSQESSALLSTIQQAN